MLKTVPHTDALNALVAKAYGDPSVDASTVSVFEAVFANSKPLVRRTGGIYQNAVMQPDVMLAMERQIAAGEYPGLQIMHRSNSLPVGKVISAKMRRSSDGGHEIGGLFYIPNSESDYVKKINSGVVGEVSVGMLNANLLCSACGWDYMGEDATFDNLYGCQCAAGHKIGKDGVHVQIHGLKAWKELSLVDRGAVTGANILARPAQSFGRDANRAAFANDDHVRALAARGCDLGFLYLAASVSDTAEPPHQERQAVTIDPEKYAAVLADVTIEKSKVNDLTAQLSAVNATVTTLNAEVTSLKAQLAASGADKLAAVTTTLAEATAFVDAEANAALALLGRSGEALPETISKRIALTRECRLAAMSRVPVGGASRSAASAGDTHTDAAAHAAYRARK